MLTYILVHGALLSSSAWLPVQTNLQLKGNNVVTVDVPGRDEDGFAPSDVTLKSAASRVCQIASYQKGKVILVGHSQGGAVITQAVNECASHIAALAYVAAVVPKSGEQVFQLLSDQDNANFDKIATLDANSGLYKINYQGPIKEMFMADASNEQATHAINNMVPEPAKIGGDVLSYNEDTFNKIPKYYIRTSQDQIISPETQAKYLARTKFKHVYTMNTGHSPFISAAPELANILNEIGK